MNRSCLDLMGRVAVVFGATSGLGKAVAIGLAEHGADVVPVGRRGELVTEVAGAIEKAGRRSIAVTADVEDRASIQKARDAALENFRRVDILVNAAGMTFRKPTMEVTDTEWDALFDVNLRGVLHTSQDFHNALKASGAGRIVNIASLGSFVAFHEVAAYCASKAAVLSLTRNMACEWARDGICVNAIAPGVFPTQMNSRLLEGTERGREILMRTPMGRFGEPHEVVGAAVLLSSKAASFITGQCLAVDGGFLASGVNS